MKKKILIMLTAALAVVLLCPLNALAADKGARAAQIARTLTGYKVSADWPPDLKSNSELLDELKALVESFDSADVLALGADKDTVIKYYTKYCEALKLTAQLPEVFTDSEISADFPNKEKAVTILAALIRGQVNPEVEGDIEANSTEIESLLMTVFSYTPEECKATPQAERDSIKAYLTGLYKLKGWDLAELDLLFSASDYPLQTQAPAPKKSVLETPPPPQNTNTAINQNTPDKNDTDNSAIATGILALAIWLALLSGTVIVLKQRNEKKYRA